MAISIHSLCEFAWVLNRHYGVPHAATAGAIRGLAETGNDRTADGKLTVNDADLLSR